MSFDATGLASGVYVYRFEAENPSASSGQSFVETKKLLFLRMILRLRSPVSLCLSERVGLFGPLQSGHVGCGHIGSAGNKDLTFRSPTAYSTDESGTPLPVSVGTIA
jgi:hypothetical protein